MAKMIQGNQTWTQALAKPQKWPYYVVEIPDFAIAIASFSAAVQVATTLSGYGVTIYGVGGYGT
jgi:sugar phosphate isomerase/epimerase